MSPFNFPCYRRKGIRKRCRQDRAELRMRSYRVDAGGREFRQ